MTTSEAPSRTYVWAWLPGATEPVPAGVLVPHGDVTTFRYGRSYLERADAVPLYLPELPLRPGSIPPVRGLRMAGCIADAGPDAWGQRVVLHRRLGRAGRDTDPAELDPLVYLLESSSDRTGALDFQEHPDACVPRSTTAPLEAMLGAAELVDQGQMLPPALADALLGGSSLGGARPKVALESGGRHLIAKFPSHTDTYPVVRAEAVAMALARRVGIEAARTELVECLGRDVLLVERFDRTATPGERRMVVSALTILELDELFTRYATYHDLADAIRARFTEPDRTLRELFSRIVFNVLVGNTDDHARNHAAWWDGEMLALAPAYDLCPQPRSGGEAVQAMAIGPDGSRHSRLTICVAAAPTYHLTAAEARAVVDRQLEVIRSRWGEAADEARLTEADRRLLWGRQIVNPYCLEGYGA